MTSFEKFIELPNLPTENIYKAFNDFIFTDDYLIIGKLLQRHIFFEKIKDLPGDIVELGVFKGSGIATWCKLIELNNAYSNSKVIGFDLFDTNNDIITKYKNGDSMNHVYNRVNSNDLTLETVNNNLDKLNTKYKKYLLIKGDIVQTTKKFVDENPGLRISLLYIDVDLSEPTYHGLKNLWDNIIPGGYIIFDEYNIHKFDECNGVDKFLKENNIEYEIKSINSIAPTAYLIKKK